MNTPVGTPPPVDPTPPAVQLFSPASGASLWGVTAIRALASDPSAAAAVREGNQKALGPLVGFVMRETKGRADGGEVRRLILERLGTG